MTDRELLDKALVRPLRISKSGYSIKDANGIVVAAWPDVDFPIWLDRAEAIVRAVNSHAALLDVAEKAKEVLRVRALLDGTLGTGKPKELVRLAAEMAYANKELRASLAMLKEVQR